MSTPSEIDPPECPVCLQPYDSSTTTPRILSCGHSACQSCLTLLQNPFPNTIRCPACTQLVKFTNYNSLPKNIDLLRFSSQINKREIKVESVQNPHQQNNENTKNNGSLENPHQQNPEKATKVGSLQNPHQESPDKPRKDGFVPFPDHQFIPDLWTYEFFLKWRKWVVSENCVVLESGDKDGFFSTLCGRCLVEGGSKNVSLVRIGSFGFCDDMKMRYSYVSKVMWVLHKMTDEERDELWSILGVSSLRRVCKVHGFWYNNGDRGLYMVGERFVNNFWEDVKCGGNVFLGKNSSDELFCSTGFAMIGMEICEAISYLHSEGLFCGCLTVDCFCLSEFGHVYIDLNETLVSTRKIGRLFTDVIAARGNVKDSEISVGNDASIALAFVSPEIFIELSEKVGIDIECDLKNIGYGSDVWSLACLLLTLLYGQSFLKLVTVVDSDYIGFYRDWREKVGVFLEGTVVSKIELLQENICNCLFLDPGSRPLVFDMWKCIRGLFIKPEFDIVANTTHVDKTEDKGGVCLFWGELRKLGGQVMKSSEKKLNNDLENENENGEDDDIRVGGKNRDLIEGLSEGHIKCIDLKGHLDCVTGLAVGGGFLFSSSYDKTVQVWSLQDFAHVHTFKGHEHKVMALVFVDKEQPLCISVDGGGGIFIWDVSYPLRQEPIKKLYEEKDWRYSGIHCLTVSRTEYLYTGSGDKSIKAWSLQDYTLSSIMNGHNSVVSTLAVCDGVLYSGSWDGTVRLWCLSDHSPLAVLGEDRPGNVTSVLSLAAYGQVLAVAHEDGTIKIWRNNALLKCAQAHKGAIFSASVGGKWLFTGGWDKAVNVQELLADDTQVDAIPIGSIACNAVITALFYWQGKLFVGQADRVVKVCYYGS